MGTAFESPPRSLVRYFDHSSDHSPDHSSDQADATDALSRMSET
jgi:hypothetical protein